MFYVLAKLQNCECECDAMTLYRLTLAKQATGRWIEDAGLVVTKGGCLIFSESHSPDKKFQLDCISIGFTEMESINEVLFI